MSRVAAALLVSLVVASCSSPPTPPSGDPTDLHVYAASSLTAAFTQLGMDFEDAHPNMEISFTFGSSTDLAKRIANGEGADVFASASFDAMETLMDTPGLEHRSSFATNHLVIVTPPDNPANVRSLDSLTAPMALVIGAEGTPIGDYTRTLLDAQGLEHAVLTNVVSNEPDDASVVSKVEGGDVDAGIVYTSDIPITAGRLLAVDIPRRVNITAIYPIAAVTGSSRQAAAAAFVAFVLGDHGQVVLESHGFGPPPR
jgi:molybdate transport system substrate-binding protein